MEKHNDTLKVAVYMRTRSISSENESSPSLDEQVMDTECLKAIQENIQSREPITLFVRESDHPGANESLQKQSERLAAYCETNGYLIYDKFTVIGSRQDSIAALRDAIECAKETKSKALLMASANRVVGTRSELEAVTKLLDDAGVTIITMDRSYENAAQYHMSPEGLIAMTLADAYNEDDADNKTN